MQGNKMPAPDMLVANSSHTTTTVNTVVSPASSQGATASVIVPMDNAPVASARPSKDGSVAASPRIIYRYLPPYSASNDGHQVQIEQDTRRHKPDVVNVEPEKSACCSSSMRGAGVAITAFLLYIVCSMVIGLFKHHVKTAITGYYNR